MVSVLNSDNLLFDQADIYNNNAPVIFAGAGRPRSDIKITEYRCEERQTGGSYWNYGAFRAAVTVK